MYLINQIGNFIHNLSALKTEMYLRCFLVHLIDPIESTLLNSFFILFVLVDP